MKNAVGSKNDMANSSRNIRNIIIALFWSLSVGSVYNTYGQNNASVNNSGPTMSEQLLQENASFSEHIADPVKRLEKYMLHYREIIEYNLIEQINILRQEKKIPPLVKNNQLTKAAQKHAEDMAKNNYFSHTSKNGSKRQERARSQGFRGIVYENIGKKYYSIQHAIQEQRNSPVHYNNMTHPTITQVGIGYEDGYRVIVFGQ